MHTDQINHDPAHTVFNTGTILPGRPSMGSWINYAIGSETTDLPGYVVLVSQGGGQGQPISSRQWSNGFLPGKTQGVQFNSKGDAVHYVNSPKGVTLDHQARLIKNIERLNAHLRTKQNDPAIETRIAQYELALKMQSSVPELTDFTKESKATIDMYGCTPGDGSYASNCLMARKLAENGVRFIQLYHRGWDHHGNLKGAFPNAARLTDQATSALITDLDQRGMLEDTLIIFGGEFCRTPMAQGTGRDHHMSAFTHVLIGGGMKGGINYGKTDEFGYEAVDGRMSTHDFHATIMHLLGIDHERLTYNYAGRDFRLTDVYGDVAKEIMASWYRLCSLTISPETEATELAFTAFFTARSATNRIFAAIIFNVLLCGWNSNLFSNSSASPTNFLATLASTSRLDSNLVCSNSNLRCSVATHA